MSHCEVRMPFIDNNLIDYIYSLPDIPGENSNVYKKMLLNNSPDVVEDMPWQKTGIPISWTEEYVSKKEVMTMEEECAYPFTDYL